MVFDAYGTLLDVHGAMRRHADRLPPDWARISAEWRTKQLEHSWVRTLTGPGQHRDFWEVTRDALEFVAARHRISDPQVLDALMESYRHLPAYPDAAPALEALRRAGLATAILSNGEPGMLDEAVRAARLHGLLDAVLSAEEVGAFKPLPSVYHLAVEALGGPANTIAYVSANAWDAQAAAVNGLRTIWCNRTGSPPEYGLDHSATMLDGLETLPALLG